MSFPAISIDQLAPRVHQFEAKILDPRSHQDLIWKTHRLKSCVRISQSYTYIYRVVKGGGSKGRGFPNIP